MNPARVKKETEGLMKSLLDTNLEEYIAIAKDAKRQAYRECLEADVEPKFDAIDALFVTGLLQAFNPITGYLYYPEADRKRLRLSEGINTARAYTNRDAYHESLRSFANLWYTQSRQYADSVLDDTTKKVYEKSGVKYVQWVTEHDSKVCEICRARDGFIYAIEKVPPKPHYNCRCTLRPMARDYKPTYEDTDSES